jgi:hypothetical protein
LVKSPRPPLVPPLVPRVVADVGPLQIGAPFFGSAAVMLACIEAAGHAACRPGAVRALAASPGEASAGVGGDRGRAVVGRLLTRHDRRPLARHRGRCLLRHLLLARLLPPKPPRYAAWRRHQSPLPRPALRARICRLARSQPVPWSGRWKPSLESRFPACESSQESLFGIHGTSAKQRP